MTTKASNPPLPFSETLRDLALLRASDIDFSSLLPSGEPSPGDEAVTSTASEESVQRSYEFVKEARAAIKVLNRGDVEIQGSRVEDLRSKIEDVLMGLEEKH